MAGEQDTELTLSTGKLLGIFFGLVALCGIFFSLGYAVGKNATPAASAAVLDSATLSTVAPSGAAKPAAGRIDAPAPVTDASTTTSSQPATDTSVQKSLQQKDSNPQLTPPEAAKQEPVLPAPAAAPKTEIAAPSAAAGAGYMVQVAAVSKQEDADSLVNALRKKQYPVFVVSNLPDKLFHVQVGPFPQQKDAEAMRTKLAADGYNAIVKK